MGSVLTEKVGHMEKNIKKLRIRKMSKDVVGCVQNVVGKNSYFNLKMIRRERWVIF